MASCLCNISNPMLVFSSRASAAQLFMEAAGSEMAFSEKLSKLEKKALWIDESDKLMAINLWTRCEMLKREQNIQVVLMDDYRFLVDDYFHEIPDELKLTMLQRLTEKLEIAIIAQQCPINETDEQERQDFVFHNNWWDNTQKETGTRSIFDYWES